ncbi:MULTISPECIES: phosphatase PAP2 family protein [Clostridium]|uniref:Phosphatase PAP2 family protein n=3 Tax=Clostridium TaxID=1485 RepID=A0A3M0SWG7_9CLOT|nr:MULTISPECIES: phosphatase PAP2 family protein [Clostridium]ADK14760.1 putative phosphoesterase [Clostridium ljungdahlii DSM 13528]AGY78008.1 phosphatase PAP2 family protein [Clostridium autoethanogenum DSM 10061]ALU38142.1 PAP2-like protein [Clostridium autoethanogenum DSM 10061]OAA85958.1 putative undecaprenyl-diphosphatase YbjG [Clostridium ljungdahlii DSM 13528]OVY50906.1 putative undecaprenyl-diphosphatase YbjG [Clostridium autoethanogenum]
MVKVKKLTILNFLGFVITSILVMCNYTKKFDNAFANFMKIYKNHLLKKSANILAVIASPKKILLISLILISFISIILLIFNKWNKINNISDNLKLLLFTILIAYFSNDVLKNLFKRARPSVKVISKVDKYSFPSDHSMMAFAFFITIAYILCQYIQSKSIKFIICFLSIFMTILIGLSRVYLGKHFMTDIIGGYFLSGFILCFLIWIICSISKYSINEQKI